MAIDADGLKTLEDSLVHDETELRPEGWGIYATPKFLSRLTLLAYLFMIALVVAVDFLFHGEKLPLVLMPGSLFVALPFALVALYLEWTNADDPESVKQRTSVGRWVAGALTYVVLQVLTTGTWIGISLAFTLH